MRKQRFLRILAGFLVAWLALGACAPAGGVEPSGACGDGICDQAEQEDPNLCPADCPPAETFAPPEGGGCGDGVCDELEQADSDLCPADCEEETRLPTGSKPWQTTGIPDYEPSINVYMILHIDPIGDLGQQVFRIEPGMYTRTRDEIDWLIDEAARHELQFAALYNGWFTKWALENDDLDQFVALLQAGHEIGSHTHQITYDPALDAWVLHAEELSIFGRPNYDPEIARQAWDDANRYVMAILDAIGAEDQNQAMCSTALSLSDERDLMAEFGFSLAPGNRLEAGFNYLGHMPWNPWRAANTDEPGYEIAEDLSSPYISINHGAQIGESISHSSGVTLTALKRQFLQLYIEWLSRERTGAEDRVWSFGFVYHPNQGDKYNVDLAAFLDWLDANFINHQSPYGNTIARYATIGEIAAEFAAWEQAHPGVSSFHYVDGGSYPYSFAHLAEGLTGAAFESHVDLGPGVAAYRFSRDGESIYVLWSDQAEVQVDLSAELQGTLRITYASGEETLIEAGTLRLTADPVMVKQAQ